jgi:1-acyl-sn-glycerol-3-phosphate acyltransferase
VPESPPPDADADAPRVPQARSSPLDLARELYTYVGFALCATATLPAVGVSNLLHRGELPRQPGRWVRRVGRATTALTPLWDFAIEGTPPTDIQTRAYVVVANHLSHADPFLLSSLPWDMRWVGKESLFRTPVLGWIMSLGGDISLKRGSGDSVRAMLDECRRSIDGGLSVMLFPEGTRSGKSGVQPFKDGAFDLAIDRGVPVLPIAIAGTENCMRKGSGRLGRAKARARILEPIETKGLTAADLPRIRELARERISLAAADLATSLASNATG